MSRLKILQMRWAGHFQHFYHFDTPTIHFGHFHTPNSRLSSFLGLHQLRALRKTQRKYGVDHPKTLAALLDFASFTSPEEAEQLYTDALNRCVAERI